ncbi:hypothetical protein EHRUM4_04240 [Ehrlichia ruminantium]|uniref:Uncharacterized protein n=1 Tax=Ehrlichia ruminantium TaxID=779 RepID=A0A161MLC1_EHRRU|nr:hypothetical protein EHRUM4_04240 [Ehrlichia ruminantium]GAT77203.1 hypothetical protein EHRUM2_04170 [Ehrlichia ruminantium]GAT78293.1 hypothetical protein EHRUM3_05100 [Ehrlichia ruminantium]
MLNSKDIVFNILKFALSNKKLEYNFLLTPQVFMVMKFFFHYIIDIMLFT